MSKPSAERHSGLSLRALYALSTGTARQESRPPNRRYGVKLQTSKGSGCAFLISVEGF